MWGLEWNLPKDIALGKKVNVFLTFYMYYATYYRNDGNNIWILEDQSDQHWCDTAYPVLNTWAVNALGVSWMFCVLGYGEGSVMQEELHCCVKLCPSCWDLLHLCYVLSSPNKCLEGQIGLFSWPVCVGPWINGWAVQPYIPHHTAFLTVLSIVAFTVFCPISYQFLKSLYIP